MPPRRKPNKRSRNYFRKTVAITCIAFTSRRKRIHRSAFGSFEDEYAPQELACLPVSGLEVAYRKPTRRVAIFSDKTSFRAISGAAPTIWTGSSHGFTQCGFP